MSPRLSAALIAAAVLFNLVFLAPELAPVPPLNDGALHYPLIMRTIAAIERGESILGHWNSTWVLGFPVFNYYAHLPHIIVAFAQKLLSIDALTLFNATRYVMLALFPVALFAALRMFTFSPTAATFAAVAAPMISARGLAGFEFESYVWGGSGMYAQIWGMTLLPLTVAALFRFFRTGRALAFAVALTAVILVSHTLYAYMAVLSAAALLLVGDAGGTASFVRRSWRLAAALALAGVVVSYFLVPYALTSQWLNRSIWEAQSKYDSYGHAWVMSKLLSGELLDSGRVPVLTILMAIGAAYAIVRRQTVDCVTLVLTVVWLALYFGRPTWGALYRVLPLDADLHIHRFIGGVHFGALALIGLGAEAIVLEAERWGKSRGRRWRTAAIALVIVLLVPVFAERARYLNWNRGVVALNEIAMAAAQADIDALVNALRAAGREGPGRVYAGLPAVWGGSFRVGDVPIYALLSFYGIDALGYAYHAMSFGADIQYHFDETNPQHYELFNVAAVVAPPSWQPPPFLRAATRTDRWTIYRTPAVGYFSLSTAPYLHAERRDDVYPAALAAVKNPNDPALMSGRIESQKTEGATYSAEVVIERPATLMFRMNYHPWWRAAVDGESRPVSPIGPAFVGVPLSPGDHQVTLRFEPPAYKRWLFRLGWIALVMVAAAPRIWRKRWSRTSPGRS